jgi:hypothetical protein
MKEDIQKLIEKLELKIKDKQRLQELNDGDEDWYHAKIVAYRDCIRQLKQILDKSYE